ncbi:MAG: acetylxylan esterase [Opitutaceae bacterium]|jgi:dienelactone hydrolase|nr:acetylxylan esterase [Opitutaceae bacterium]
MTTKNSSERFVRLRLHCRRFFRSGFVIAAMAVMSVCASRAANENTDTNAWFAPTPGWALQKLDWAKRTQPSAAWRIVVASGAQAQARIEWSVLTGKASSVSAPVSAPASVSGWTRVEWRLSRDCTGSGGGTGGGAVHSGTVGRTDASAADGLLLPAVADGGWWLTVKQFGADNSLRGLERFFLNVWNSPLAAAEGKSSAMTEQSAQNAGGEALRLFFENGTVRISGLKSARSGERGAVLGFSIREFDEAEVRRGELPLAAATATGAREIALPEATPGRALRVLVEARINGVLRDAEELWVFAPGDSSPAPDWLALAGNATAAKPVNVTRIFSGETVSSTAPFESQRAGLEAQIAGLRARGSGAVQLWVQWGKIETFAGACDWKNLDAYVSFLTGKGVPFTLASAGSVLFGNGPLDTWSDWMLDHKGEFKLWRGLPSVSPASRAWQEGARRFTRRLIERYRDNPLLAGYVFIGQGMDSGIFTDHFNSITDYSPAARTDFVRYLKKRYGSIGALSAAWSAGNAARQAPARQAAARQAAAWRDWTEVLAPLPRLEEEVNLSRPWLDWTDWKLAVYRESTVDLFDPLVEELDPERTVIHYTAKTGPFEHLLRGVRLRSWGTADGAGEDYRMDRINGITRNRGLWRQTESHEVPPANIGYMSDMVAQTLRGGADHVRFNLVWNSLPALFQKTYPENAALQETLRWWSESAPLREELAGAHPLPAELGVVISWADLLHRRRVWRWYAMPGDRADKLVRASGFLPVQWLSEWTPAQSWLGLRTVLVPEDALIWDERLTTRLESFVRGGGQLVVWGRAGKYALRRDGTGGASGAGGAAFAWTERFGRTGFQEEQGKVDTRAGAGVREWVYGTGRVRWCVSDATGQSERLVAGLIEASGVARRVVISDPAVEGFFRVKGDRHFLVLNRFLGFGNKADPKPLEVTVRLPGLPGLEGEWSVRRVLAQSADTSSLPPVPSWEAFSRGTARVALLPSEMQVFELSKAKAGGAAGATTGAEADPLAVLRDALAPRILREVTEPLDVQVGAVPEGVSVRQVVFESCAVNASAVGGRMVNEVYAVIARPVARGPHPGLLLMHGGMGFAETKRAVLWASRGYVIVTLDIPGIADPKKVPHSAGLWTKQPYQHDRWRVKPVVEDSMMFQSVAGAVQALHLLRSLPDVDAARVGVHGISWGGYMTAMVCSIAGDKVRAGFSIYGSGYYEQCRYRDDLNRLPAAERADWFRLFDAERRAHAITAPYFIAAASNDFAFWPPAVERTLEAVSGPANLLYAPNANHKLPVPGGSRRDNWADMAEFYFGYHLQGSGESMPVVSWIDGYEKQPASGDAGTGGGRTLRFRVTASRPITKASVWHSLPTGDWRKREWKEAPAMLRGDSVYEVELPAVAVGSGNAGGDCFALVSDDRPVSVSSRMRKITAFQ